MMPERFANIESEPVTVTKPTKVTGPRTLTLRLSEPTDIGERYSEVNIGGDVLEDFSVAPEVMLLQAYQRLQVLLNTDPEGGYPLPDGRTT